MDKWNTLKSSVRMEILIVAIYTAFPGTGIPGAGHMCTFYR